MFENFSLPNWYNAPEEITSFLAQLWNKSYSELYDEDFFGKDETTYGELEQDINTLLKLFKDEEYAVFQSRLIYFNWALCLACKPTIDAWLKDKDDVEPFNFVLDNLKSWDIRKHFHPEFLDYEIKIDDYPGAIGEAVFVYQNLIKIATHKNVIDIVADSIDCCTEGAAIAPGSEDKRAIFNWILIDVFPAAYCLRLPEFIYTINFRLRPNWKYNKIL